MDANSDRRKNIGLFRQSDPILQGIKWGNWGSRPYEYAWASKIVSVADKKVIDLGIGLPSQYNWYAHVINKLRPLFYAGIDWDARILNETIKGDHFEVSHMDMASLTYKDKEFDVAYCISTFEHIPYDIFIKTIQEAHRVIKDDGFLVITLDEEWDKNLPFAHDNGWNNLEQSVIEIQKFRRVHRSFGLPEFLELIKDYFILAQDDAVVDPATNDIISSKDNFVYYHRNNRDYSLLNSGDHVNSCVSYALLKKINQ